MVDGGSSSERLCSPKGFLLCRTWRSASPCFQKAVGELLDGRSTRLKTARESRRRVNESACLLNENADSGALWHPDRIARLVMVLCHRIQMAYTMRLESAVKERSFPS